MRKRYMRRQERAKTLCVIVGSVVFNYLLLGGGQIKTMIDVWASIPKKPMIEDYKIVETREMNYTEKQQIMDYIVELFEDDANLAITMLTKCENSKLDSQIQGHNRNGTTDNGVFQINSIHATPEEMRDWKANVDMAYKIYQGWGNKFTAWTCAPVINQKNYLRE